MLEIQTERRHTHGDYSQNCSTIYAFNDIAQECCNYSKLTDIQRHSMYQIYTKLARILTGDNNHVDSWTDLIGYSELVIEELEKGIPRPELITAQVNNSPYYYI